jgi:hypothetical protein
MKRDRFRETIRLLLDTIKIQERRIETLEKEAR